MQRYMPTHDLFAVVYLLIARAFASGRRDGRLLGVYTRRSCDPHGHKVSRQFLTATYCKFRCPLILGLLPLFRGISTSQLRGYPEDRIAQTGLI